MKTYPLSHERIWGIKAGRWAENRGQVAYPCPPRTFGIFLDKCLGSALSVQSGPCSPGRRGRGYGPWTQTKCSMPSWPCSLGLLLYLCELQFPDLKAVVIKVSTLKAAMRLGLEMIMVLVIVTTAAVFQVLVCQMLCSDFHKH